MQRRLLFVKRSLAQDGYIPGDRLPVIACLDDIIIGIKRQCLSIKGSVPGFVNTPALVHQLPGTGEYLHPAVGVIIQVLDHPFIIDAIVVRREGIGDLRRPQHFTNILSSRTHPPRAVTVSVYSTSFCTSMARGSAMVLFPLMK